MNLENRVQKLEELVKNLSDKEESKWGSFAGQFCGKNIYFECADSKIWDNFQKALQGKSFLFEEPKQEESKFLHNDDKCGDGWHTIGCEHEKTESKQEDCEHEISGKCVKCGKDSLGSKQSTSLKEDRNSLKYQISYLLWNENNFTKEETDRYSDQILKLIQSHLIKETETLEPSKYVQMDSECLEGYNICKESIIKIINNIK